LPIDRFLAISSPKNGLLLLQFQSNLYRSRENTMAKKTKTATPTKKKVSLTAKEKRVRDINTLLESIRLDWLELSKTLDDVHKTKGLKKHLRWCEEELKELTKKADK
jgi:hypothetical protein